jgi:hypothetical protein
VITTPTHRNDGYMRPANDQAVSQAGQIILGKERQIRLPFACLLARTGIVRQPNEDPADFAKYTVMLRPDLALSAASISALYIALRYAPHPKGSDLRQFGKRVSAFQAKPD